MVMRVAIIGGGLIGNKRARALGDCRLVAAVDKDIERAEQLALAARLVALAVLHSGSGG